MAVPDVVLTRAGLSLEELYRVAAERARLRIAPEADEHVRAGRAVVERALAGERLVYGLNSGLGHLRDQRVSHAQLLGYQVRMVVAHAGGVGPALPDEDVRALMVARVAGIARGGSGARPEALHMLVDMLNAGIHPVVPEVGSVGASDLMHMAAVAMVMIGRGEARVDGKTLGGGAALEQAGLRPYVLQPKEGLAMLSANGASIGLGALAVLEAERIANLADLAGALTLETIGANLSPFDAEAAAAKPIPGQIAAAAHVRDLLAGSYLTDPATTVSVQDPLSFRVMPQVHGALREQIGVTRRSVEIELNAIDDNPLVSIEHDRMLSNGNFHPMALALSFDALRVALAHVGMLSERRMNKVIWLKFGQPESFTSGVAAEAENYSVAGLLAYSAAAVLSELKHLAAPATLESPPLDLDIEDHATLAPLTVALTRRALRLLETILTIEALLAVEALDNKATLPRLGTGTQQAYTTIHEAIRAGGPGTAAAAVVEAVRRALRP